MAMLPGSVFEFTSRFLPAGLAEKLVSIYALRQAITSIPCTAADDSVKWAKLKWWREELTADPCSTSRHPILRAMHHSGARNKLGEGLLQRLLADAVMQMDVFPDPDRQTLYSRLAVQGETDILLELALDEAEISTQNLQAFSLATGLFAMISGFLPGYQSKIHQLPLDMLAQYQVNAPHLEQHPPVSELAGIVKQLAGSGVDSYDKGMSGLTESGGGGVPMHLLLRFAVESRRLQSISENTQRSFGELSPYGPSYAWFAWKFCRRLNRSQ